MQSPQDRALDSGHMEMMRVLASEAVIALENARLFREERAKSRHLTAVEQHFAQRHYDAESGRNAGEDRRRARAGTGLFAYRNRVAGLLDQGNRRPGRGRPPQGSPRAPSGTGRQCGGEGRAHRADGCGCLWVSRTPRKNRSWKVPSSAIALPIVYADQLHGVLYVETDQRSDFPQEEILFLGTLADLISGALHNALTFQKAQEQAITDGLTGLKTHRFFMEALSGEWKRSTRAGRSFSLVLMDLDRFKFVNDFYGHLDGDLVLQRVAHILEQNCRRSDVVARYGGDEFVILMPETDAEQSHQLAAKLRSWISADPVLREKNVTSSFGVASFPRQRIDASGTDSGRRRFDVPLQTSGRQRGFHRGPIRRERFQTMEAGSARCLSRRHAQAPVRYGPGRIRGNLQPDRAIREIVRGNRIVVLASQRKRRTRNPLQRLASSRCLPSSWTL